MSRRVRTSVWVIGPDGYQAYVSLWRDGRAEFMGLFLPEVGLLIRYPLGVEL